MSRLSLYVTAPPFMHVARLGDSRPPLGSILLADIAERPATAEELRGLFALAPWCPVCVLLRSTAERRRIPRSPRMCSVSSLVGGGGAGSILAAIRERPRPAPMEMAEWLADRARAPGLRAPLATLFGRAISGASSSGLGATWSEAPIPPLGNWPGTTWQEVARLADLAANREAMGRLLTRRNSQGVQAVRAMDEFLGATEEEFRERAGWEWVFEAAVRRSREMQMEVVSSAFGTARIGTPADAARLPASVPPDWPLPGAVGDVPVLRAAAH
jgi:PAS domain-containing protein